MNKQSWAAPSLVKVEIDKSCWNTTQQATRCTTTNPYACNARNPVCTIKPACGINTKGGVQFS